jgi:CDP-4-dehydro-6-deoxyglucose reductase, E3
VDYGKREPLGLTTGEKTQGLVLLCQVKPTSDLLIRARIINTPENIPIKNIPMRVVAKQQLSHDVIKLLLEPVGNSRLQFIAGQYIDIILADGQRRSFSIASSPHGDELIELHIRHIEDGEFSALLYSQLKVKDVLRVEGPFGQFYLHSADIPLIFMAGGTGFAPIKSIIECALQDGIEQVMYLYWGVRTRQDLYLDDLPQQWSRKAGFHYVPVLSDTPVADQWRGRQGMVHEVIAKDFSDLANYALYAAGPPAMIKAGWEALSKNGLRKDRYYSDAFTFAHDTLAGNNQ